MLLTDLPEELLDLVLRHATRGALQQLRLTSKLFDRLASPLVWDRIWISSHPLDLHVFKRVTASRFASNIRELVWDDTTFQRPLLDLNWTDFVRVNESGHESRRGAKYAPTRGAFEQWCSVASAHHDIRNNHFDQESLNKAIPKLTNLKRVVLTNRNVEPIPHEDAVPEFGSSPTVRYWKQLPERVPFPPSVCWYDDSHSVGSVALADLLDVDYLDDGLPDLAFLGALENARPFRGLAILLRALSAEKKRSGKLAVEEFIVRPTYEPWTEIGPGISYLFFSQCFAEIVHVFEGLRVLNLVISNGRDKGGGIRVMQRQHMARVLSSARQLEDLTLEMDFLPVLTTDEGRNNTGALKSVYRYEKLKKVSFINGVFQTRPLLGFLRNHGEVLKDVHFCNCVMSWHPYQEAQKTWKELLLELKTEKLRYRTFVIQNCKGDRPGDPAEQVSIYNNTGRSSTDFENFFEGNGAIPLDEEFEEQYEIQNEVRFESYNRYY